MFDDVIGAEFHHDRAQTAPNAPTFVLRDVRDFTTWDMARPAGEVHSDSATKEHL